MWKPCAITAIVFMSVVSFVGWWYQRRMRDLFQDRKSAMLPHIFLFNEHILTQKEVRRIDQNERRDTRASRPDRGRVRPRATSGVPLTVRTLTPSIPSAMPVSAPRAMSGASAVTTGYGGYGSYSGQGGGYGRPYGSLGGRNSMVMMSGALSAHGHGSTAGVSSSLPAQSGIAGPSSIATGSTAGSLGGRIPSPMGPGSIGNVPEDSSAQATIIPSAGGSIFGPSGAAAPNNGLDAAAAGPSRRTPYRRTPSPNEPLTEAEEPPY
jgi:hypothetical protein